MKMSETNMVLYNPTSDLTNGHGFYTNLPTETKEDKIKIYNLQQGKCEKLADHVGETIEMVAVLAEYVNLTRQSDGAEFLAPRIIIVDKKGKSYSCVSEGVSRCLKSIFNIFGWPETWKDPMKIVPRMIKTTGTKQVMNIELIA